MLLLLLLPCSAPLRLAWAQCPSHPLITFTIAIIRHSGAASDILPPRPCLIFLALLLLVPLPLSPLHTYNQTPQPQPQSPPLGIVVPSPLHPLLPGNCSSIYLPTHRAQSLAFLPHREAPYLLNCPPPASVRSGASCASTAPRSAWSLISWFGFLPRRAHSLQLQGPCCRPAQFNLSFSILELCLPSPPAAPPSDIRHHERSQAPEVRIANPRTP